MGSADELKPWGRVFERLRVQRGLTITELCYRARMGPPQYRVICYKLVDGPSFQTMERLLKALNCTWGEWGGTVDAMQAGAAQASAPVAQELKAVVGERRKPDPGRGRRIGLDPPPKGLKPHP